MQGEKQPVLTLQEACDVCWAIVRNNLLLCMQAFLLIGIKLSRRQTRSAPTASASWRPAGVTEQIQFPPFPMSRIVGAKSCWCVYRWPVFRADRERPSESPPAGRHSDRNLIDHGHVRALLCDFGIRTATTDRKNVGSLSTRVPSSIWNLRSATGHNKHKQQSRIDRTLSRL